MAKKDRKQEKQNKKPSHGLFAALFAPLDELEDDGIDYDTEFDDEEALDEDGELIHLFDDDEVEFSEEEDFEAADSLVWEDGERVVQSCDPLDEDPLTEDFETEPDKPARRKKRGKKKKQKESLPPDDRELLGEVDPLPEEITLFDDDSADEPQHRSGGRTRIYRTNSTAQNEELPPETEETADPETPSEDIRLFDETDADKPQRPSSGKRTRIFRTGSGTAMRVNINETQQSRAVDEAQRKNRERQAEIQHEKYVKKKTRQQKRRDFFKRIAMNVLFGAFIVVAVAAAIYYTFLLSDIIVTGNDDYSAEYIVEISGLGLGQHMFFVDLDTAKAKIEENPYLQVNDISYIFPSRVRMDITERKEVAGIIGLDYNVIIDHNGYVLSMSGGTDLSDLLQVTGISMSGFQLGQRIGESSDFSTASLVSLIEKLEEYELIHKMRSIDMTTPLAIVMYTTNGFKIHIGQPTDLDSKFQSLKTLLPRFEEKMIFTGTLYLSAKGGTVYSPQGADNAAAANAPDSDPENGGDTPLSEDWFQTGDGSSFFSGTTDPSMPTVPSDPSLPTDPAQQMQTPVPTGPTPDPMGDEFQG